jgi:hypothetical protein
VSQRIRAELIKAARAGGAAGGQSAELLATAEMAPSRNGAPSVACWCGSVGETKNGGVRPQ